MRRIHAALAALIACVVLVGYFETIPSLESSDAARLPEDAARRLHLSYWEKWGSFERDACQAMVDDFNQNQHELFVHYINTSEVNRKAMLAIMGGDPPDVVGLWGN